MKQCGKKTGFTFLEVMFTLAIVGLISVMVIPIFRNAYGNKIFGTQLKKTCTQITNATQEVMIEERATDTVTLDAQEEDEDTQKGFYFTTAGLKGISAEKGVKYLLDNFIRHNKVDCGPKGTNDCVGQKYRTPEKKDLGTIPEEFYCVRTVNSAAICMYFDENDKVIKAIVDVNAAQAPNITGVDTFVMYIDNDGYLQDLDEDDQNCNVEREMGTTVVDYAAGCFSKVVNNGWQMPKD